MTCTCGRIMLGSEDSGARNWNPDCPEHGVGTDWYNDPERVLKRAQDSARLIELQLRARDARKARNDPPR